MSVVGVKLRRIVLWMGAALLAAGMLSAHVYKQNLYIRLSRDSVKLELERRKKQNELAALELEVKSLLRRQRLEQLAVTRFGLAYSGAPEPIYRDEISGSGSDATGSMALAAFDGDADTRKNWATGAVRWLTDGL